MITYHDGGLGHMLFGGTDLGHLVLPNLGYPCMLTFCMLTVSTMGS